MVTQRKNFNVLKGNDKKNRILITLQSENEETMLEHMEINIFLNIKKLKKGLMLFFQLSACKIKILSYIDV
jgi:hypothetical protein